MSGPRTSAEWNAFAARLRAARPRTPMEPSAGPSRHEREVLEHLGPALGWLRRCRGLKQHEVAASAGITRPMLSAYERGKSKPALETLEKILAAMRCNLGQLGAALELVSTALPGAADKGIAGDEQQAFLRLSIAVQGWLDAVRLHVLHPEPGRGEPGGSAS